MEAIALVCVSVFFHLAWNVTLKRRSSDARFLVALKTGATLVCIPFVFFALLHPEAYLPSLPYLLGSSACNAAYFLCLMYAYRFGDFSLAYPVSRSVPIVLVAAGGLLFGERLPPEGMAAIAIVAAGCTVLPLGDLRGRSLRVLVSPAMGFSLLTACFTAGYTVLDKFGSRPAFLALGFPGSLGYLGLHEFLTLIFLFLFSPVAIGGGLRMIPDRKERMEALVAGALMTVSSSLVLIAYQFAQASYVVGFRQLAIPFSVAYGAARMKERANLPRIAGAALVIVGVALLLAAS